MVVMAVPPWAAVLCAMLHHQSLWVPTEVI